MGDTAIVLLSGGLDSTTVLAKLIGDGWCVECININYGQRHDKEISAAKNIAKHYDVPIQCIDISDVQKLMIGSSLTDDVDVPEGHYEEDSMKDTVVPNRNMIFISIAGAYAVAKKMGYVAVGTHAGDHAIYPDCRPEFIEKAAGALIEGNYHTTGIIAPILSFNKTEIVEEGLKLKAPYHLTWTCYNGREKACGKCGSCQERLEAFENNGVKDPLEYEKDE